MDKQLPPLILLLILFSFATHAQESAWNEATASLEPYSVPTVAYVSPIYREFRKLPQLFNGYAIEVAYSDDPLRRTDPIFRQFGNIKYEKLPRGGYSYLITCRFSTREAALQFLRTVILPKVEDARLYAYAEGIRSIIRPE
ncbi:MAG: hypothetical protein RLY31_2792 [Bacteroidota bacterium]|jgi:hypothetical protein